MFLYYTWEQTNVYTSEEEGKSRIENVTGCNLSYVEQCICKARVIVGNSLETSFIYVGY